MTHAKIVTLSAVATIGGLICLTLIAIGGYQMGWWLKKEAVNRNAKINRQSYEVQQTYREETLTDITKVRDIDTQIAMPAYHDVVLELRAQRTALVHQTCDAISRLTTSGAGVDPDIATFHDKECFR